MLLQAERGVSVAKARPKKRGRRDRKANRKPTVAQPDYSVDDIGPDTPAQREGAEYLPIYGYSMPRRRKVRRHRLEIMAKPQGKRRHAQITPRQLAAGLELSERYETTLRSPSPPWLHDYVDSTPRPGDVATWQLEAKARYSELSRHVPREAKAVVFAVCCREVPIMPGFTRDPERAEVALDRLRRALDRLADALRLGK